MHQRAPCPIIWSVHICDLLKESHQKPFKYQLPV